jgi:SagB-type dehydrogenase family enzyme
MDPIYRPSGLSERFFIFMEDDQIYLWHLGTNDVYQLEPRHLKRIFEIAGGQAIESSAVDQELLESKVLGDTPRSRWQWSMPSKIFHFGTRIKLSKQRSRLDPLSQEVLDLNFDPHITIEPSVEEPEPGGDAVALPSPDLSELSGVSIWKALRTRATTRAFERRPIRLPLLSALLFGTFGEIHGPKPFDRKDIHIWSRRRSAPSGAGLHAHDAFVVALNVEGLDKGVYRYRDDQHELVRTGTTSAPADILSSIPDAEFIENVAALVIVVTRFDVMWRRYPHARAYRTALLDVGHLSQTFHLVAATLRAASWLSATFDDDLVSTSLGIDPESAAPMLILGVGYGTGYLPPTFAAALQESVERRSFFQ